jgi:hypothetical protein
LNIASDFLWREVAVVVDDRLLGGDFVVEPLRGLVGEEEVSM